MIVALSFLIDSFIFKIFEGLEDNLRTNAENDLAILGMNMAKDELNK
jgi:hypothetical protein